MDCDGILKACTTKLVPNNAKITVTRSDSRYSESVVGLACTSSAASRTVSTGVSLGGISGPAWSTGIAFSGESVSSGIRTHLFAIARLGLQQSFERAPRRLLFRFLLRAAFRARHPLAFHPNLHQKSLLMVRAALSRQTILGQLSALPLQKLLQGALAVRFRDPLSVLQGLLENRHVEQFSSRLQATVQINRRHHSFECIGQQRGLFTPAGFFLAAPEPQVVTQAESPRRNLQ